MDCFLSEGMEVIFRIALALLSMGKDELLLQDMEGVIKYFQKYMPAHFEANQEAVFKLAFEININQKKMKKLDKIINPEGSFLKKLPYVHLSPGIHQT